MKKIMFNDTYGLTAATVNGRKRMTRRNISPKLKQPVYDSSFDEAGFKALCCAFAQYKVGEVVAVAQSYGSILDELESLNNCTCMEAWEYDAPKRTDYSELMHHPGFRNKMFVRADLMPHRIRTTGLRAERLQDISDEDCIKEGVRVVVPDFATQPTLYEGAGLLRETPREAFACLIDKVLGRGTWKANPWVEVYEYELVK